MSILDQLLGGSDSESANTESSESNVDIATDPGLGLDLSDVLHSSSSESDEGGVEESEFTGIGDLGLDLSLPTFLGLSSSSDSSSVESSDGDNGGLLGGLL